jgi:ribonuclease T1
VTPVKAWLRGCGGALVLFAALCGAFAPELFKAAQARENPPTVRLSQLPAEALATLALVRQGGPFPYERDGIVFGNFERRLPVRSRGYYREYTVPTPGLSHRGARRIVAGREGELYYTSDHYRSFRRIVE